MHNKKLLARKIAITLAAGSILVSGQAFAQEEDFQLDQVVVTATRVAQEVSNVPADMTVVTAQQIEAKGARDLADALEGVPGVTIYRQGGPGAFATAEIFGSDRVVVMVDGQRINRPQGLPSGSGGVDLSTIPAADNIAKIEIVRGGGSALYGADAVGGVINIITKKGNGPTKTTADVGFGNYGTHQYKFSNSGSENGYHWYVTGLKGDTDGQRANSAFNEKNTTFRLDKDLNSKETVSFNFDYYSNHAGYPGSLTWLTPDDYGNVLRHNWGINYAKKHDHGTQIFKYYSNNENYTGYSSGIIDYRSTVNAFEYQDTNKLNQDNTLTWGGEWRKEKSSGGSYDVQPDDRTVYAGYLQDQFQISNKTNLTAGLRYDHNSQYGNNWLPKLSILHKADKDTSYFANWGRVFRSPNMSELYGPWNSGNPDLKPEKGWTAEAGIKKHLDAKNEATVSVFKQDLNNAIKYDYDTSKYQNLDNYTATGTTVSVMTKFSNNFTTDVGYTYLDSKKNDQPTGEPHNQFHVGYVLKAGKLTQSLNGQYRDERGTTTSNFVSSYFTWNTNFNYAFNDQQSIYLTINNIFDKKYEEIKGYPAFERTVFFGVKQSL